MVVGGCFGSVRFFSWRMGSVTFCQGRLCAREYCVCMTADGDEGTYGHYIAVGAPTCHETVFGRQRACDACPCGRTHPPRQTQHTLTSQAAHSVVLPAQLRSRKLALCGGQKSAAACYHRRL